MVKKVFPASEKNYLFDKVLDLNRLLENRTVKTKIRKNAELAMGTKSPDQSLIKYRLMLGEDFYE